MLEIKSRNFTWGVPKSISSANLADRCMSVQPEPMILNYNADKVPLSQYWFIHDSALNVSYRNRNCGKEKK